MTSLAKRFAQVTGVVLLLLGIVGILSGEYVLGINSSTFEDLLHIVLGIVNLAVGFSSSDSPAIKTARILGPVYILVTIAGFLMPELLGLVEPPLRIQDNLIHLVLGLVSTYAGYASSDHPTTPASA